MAKKLDQVDNDIQLGLVCTSKHFQGCKVQCNLDLVTLNLVITCDLVTIFQFTTYIHNLFIDIIRFNDSFCGNQNCH